MKFKLQLKNKAQDARKRKGICEKREHAYQVYFNYSTFKVIPLLLYLMVPKIESIVILVPGFYFKELALLFNLTEQYII